MPSQDLSALQCPACLRLFGTRQGVNSHLSSAKSCKWYRKGKIRDLSLNDIQIDEEENEALKENTSVLQDVNNSDYMDSFPEGEDGDFFNDFASEGMDEYELIPENVPATPLPASMASSSRLPSQSQNRSLEDEDDTRYIEEHPTAGKVLPSTAAADSDGDINMEEFTEKNTLSPFSLDLDWKIAEWVVKESVGHSAVDRLLEIPGVSVFTL